MVGFAGFGVMVNSSLQRILLVLHGCYNTKTRPQCLSLQESFEDRDMRVAYKSFCLE